MKLVDRWQDWRSARKGHRIHAATPQRIHAAAPRFAEGGQFRVALPGYGKTYGVADERRSEQEDGYCTTFTYYLQQISELYTMLEARSQYGSEPAKSILGHRTSFLAGEGVRVSADTIALQEWIEGWLRVNGLTGRMLTDAVSEGEVVGHVLWTIDDMGMATCHPAFVGYDGWAGSWRDRRAGDRPAAVLRRPVGAAAVVAAVRRHAPDGRAAPGCCRPVPAVAGGWARPVRVRAHRRAWQRGALPGADYAHVLHDRLDEELRPSGAAVSAAEQHVDPAIGGTFELPPEDASRRTGGRRLLRQVVP